MDKSEDKNQILKEINQGLKIQNSRKEVFIRGLIGGVATAIGATIIAGVLLGILSAVAKNYDIPALEQIIKK